MTWDENFGVWKPAEGGEGPVSHPAAATQDSDSDFE